MANTSRNGVVQQADAFATTIRNVRFYSFVSVLSLVLFVRAVMHLAPERFQGCGLCSLKKRLPIIIEVSIVSLFLCFLYAACYLVKSFVKTLLRKNVIGIGHRKTACKPKGLEPDHLSIFQRIFLCYEMFLCIAFGHLRTVLRYLGIKKDGLSERRREGYVPLYDPSEKFYVNNIMPRVSLLFNNTICGPPGAEIDVLERTSPDCGWTVNFTGRVKKEVNLASYNYLGFAQNDGPCVTAASRSVEAYGLTSCSPRNELGTFQIIKELEGLTARYLGIESCMVFGMGYAANTTNIPTLVGKGCLVLSDELNHASIIVGCRLSGATCKTFKHADMEDLEAKLIYNIIDGHPISHKKWKKILIVVEGIYSMEGTIVNLPKLIEIKQKYKAYLYLDEAHSIGAIGSHGRGVVDYFGCDPKDIDVMMGTFTKSFSASGGYIAGSKEMINHLQCSSHSNIYGASMPPPIASQIISTMRIIMGEDGSNDGITRIKQLADNTQYFRTKLQEMGFTLIGEPLSPLVVVMLYSSTKCFVHRAFQNKGVALVFVGFPVVPFGKTRLRMCLSAAHTKEMLDKALQVFDELGDWVNMKYSKGKHVLEPAFNL